MDADMNQVMDKVGNSMAKDIDKIEPALNVKMQGWVENCFSKSGNNPDRFANCLSNGQKRAAELNEHFQFKMVFLSRSVQGCLQNNRSIDKCEADAIKTGKSIIDGLLN